MKYKMKSILAILILAISLALTGCANMRWGTSAGVNVNFGPNGPRVTPHVNVNLYSGGRF
jgi:predicted small secreted protein